MMRGFDNSGLQSRIVCLLRGYVTATCYESLWREEAHKTLKLLLHDTMWTRGEETLVNLQTHNRWVTYCLPPWLTCQENPLEKQNSELGWKAGSALRTKSAHTALQEFPSQDTLGGPQLTQTAALRVHFSPGVLGDTRTPCMGTNLYTRTQINTKILLKIRHLSYLKAT